MKQVPEDIQRLLKTVFDDCMKEDTAVRERQIRQWRRLKLLWEGFQRVWYSEVAHDWRIWDQTADQDSDQSYYDKPINVFKAYLESIIAALSVGVPSIKCYPDDADNTLDLATARAGDKIAQLIYRHNDMPLLQLHALFTFVTEGPMFCYTYPVESEEYGTYEEKEYQDDEEEHQLTICSNCGNTLDDSLVTPEMNQSNVNPMDEMNPQLNNEMNPISGMEMQQALPLQMTNQMDQNEQIPLDIISQEINEFDPNNEDALLHNAINTGKEICPACAVIMDPEIKREKYIVQRLVGINKLPKSRMCMEVYGGLYVKVANFAKKQKDTPYLIFSKECDYSLAVNEYEDLHGNKELLKQIKAGNSSGSYNLYDQWGRLSPQYQGEYPLNVVTVNKGWIRSAKFNILNDKSDINKLKKLYPDGVKITFVNDQFACAENQSLDDHWTISENPMSDFIYFDPLGQGLTSVQEITNDIISLVLQTIEHGIGQTFADPAVINFKAYEQTEVIPGGIFPATPKSGKGLSEGFHELRTATLSSEVLPFSNQIQSLAQMASGALPSIFGGQIEGSETASEYSMSRAQALQRLQNIWKMQTIWWKNIFGKVIPMYIKNIKDDERDVQKDSNGNFINILIKKAELEGKIGKVELEANENLPLTWSQTKDTIEKLFQNGNPKIQEILMAPENIAILHDSLGLIDFYVPGEDDIIKQYDEIKLLLNSEPVQTGDPEVPEIASVEIDPDFDNHAIEFEICRKWIISEVGRQTKVDNEPGYRNILLHGKAHLTVMQERQMQEMQAQGVASSANPKKNTQTPIQGESDVNSQS